MINPLEYQFNYALDKYGYNAVVNNTQQVKVLLKEYDEGTNIEEYKYMLVKNGLVSQGDIIAIGDYNWIVFHENIAINDVYTKVLIRRIRHEIKFNFTGEVIPIPAIIDEGTMGLDKDIIITPEGKITLFMQENETTKRIEKAQRFLIMSSPWKVIQKINPEHGIYKIYAEIDMFNPNDDKENEIADRWEYQEKHNYIVKINNTIQNALPLNSTLQLEVTVTDNEEVVTLPLTYASSNETILMVDENGLVSCVGVGTATITVAITDNTNIKDTIDITVEEMQETTYSIEGKDSIYWNYTETYIVHKYENGEEVDANFIFELVPIDGDFATIENTTDNTVDIKADSGVYGYMKLIATDTINGKTVEKEILIKGLV